MSDIEGNVDSAEHMQLIPVPPAPRRTQNESGVRVLSLLLQALFSLILRLWLATISISIIMYFLRRIPVNPLLHHSGRIIGDKPISILIDDYQAKATPALFGKIVSDDIHGFWY
jgi:hypothetical protein